MSDRKSEADLVKVENERNLTKHKFPNLGFVKLLTKYPFETRDQRDLYSFLLDHVSGLPIAALVSHDGWFWISNEKICKLLYWQNNGPCRKKIKELLVALEKQELLEVKFDNRAAKYEAKRLIRINYAKLEQVVSTELNRRKELVRNATSSTPRSWYEMLPAQPPGAGTKCYQPYTDHKEDNTDLKEDNTDTTRRTPEGSPRRVVCVEDDDELSMFIDELLDEDSMEDIPYSPRSRSDSEDDMDDMDEDDMDDMDEEDY